MKIQSETKPQDEVKLHAERQVEKKTVFVGSEKLRPGHTCFEINEQTFVVSPAKYETVVHFGEPDRLKIIINKGFAYVNALNAKNALKRYLNPAPDTKPLFKGFGVEHIAFPD